MKTSSNKPAARFDHDQLRALAAVASEGSFERAAERLNVTPSAISQRIKLLEHRVGRLLVRRATPASATPDGEVLVRLAEQAALLEHEAYVRLGVDDAAPRVGLRVAVNHDSLESWFIDAAARFAAQTDITLDLQSEDQDHTAALLRDGSVLGAVTALAEPVQGCRIHALGSMRYVATCTPEFHTQHFSQGVNARTLAVAPVLVFNRKDAMQSRFASKVMRGTSWQPPVWWVPSARAFVQATLRGLGWTMNAESLVREHLDAGRLVPLRPRAWENVPLFWQHWRTETLAMRQLTDAVLAAARAHLR